MFTAAQVAGQGPPVLQVGDAVLDPDPPRGVGFAPALVHLLVPVGSVLLELAVRWCDRPAAGLGAQALVAGIGKDLDRGSVGQELYQPEPAGVVGVRAAAGPGRAAEQHAAVAVRDDRGPDRVLLVLAGDEPVPVPASGRRTRISVPPMIPVFPSAPRWSTISAGVRSRTPGLTVHPRSASRGRTSPMAWVTVERSTSNQQAGTSCVVACRRCTRGPGAGRRGPAGASHPRPQPASAAGTQVWPGAVRATTDPALRRVQQSGRPTGR
ncbi:putative protein OS=Streptomyces griseomycini OX=66895 GN=FHS37_003509 PE=4 SV=1 [Streptomyces griseomycini]|uniref:Uncharacterized protein n=1 Tax=Streptomyces griseomycini TaxID=66895 RepID=A0A7W7PRA9_9ACTN|nr:hypothetical protein [Streptomyces griseomycini]